MFGRHYDKVTDAVLKQSTVIRNPRCDCYACTINRTIFVTIKHNFVNNNYSNIIFISLLYVRRGESIIINHSYAIPKIHSPKPQCLEARIW